MTVDEVALGLSLQTLTPFRFSCNRLLLQRLPEIHFPPYSLIRLFDPFVSPSLVPPDGRLQRFTLNRLTLL